MLSFWAFFAAPVVGETFVFFILFGALASVVGLLWKGSVPRITLRELAIPLGLWILGSAFLVFLGFAHGGTDHALTTGATRFSAGVLPSDNDIPHFFTEWIYANGHQGTPPVYPDEWLLSDRPPLQIGYMLAQRPLLWNANLIDYQLIGILLQQLWIVAVWALLLAFKIGRVTRVLIVGTLLCSDLAITNGFFIWPKLLPAAMLIAAAALVVSPLWLELRRSLWGAALVATLLALAMLGHGASIFGAIPIAILAAYRGLPSARWIGVGLLVGIACMAPWSAYQRFEDPPGNRLTKWMLAGVVEIDDRGTREAILDSYGEAGLGGALHNKAENFVTMAGSGPFVDSADRAIDAVGEGDWGSGLRELRTILFFYFLPSLGLLLLAPVAMAAAWRRGRRNQPDWDFSLTCWSIAAIGCLFWGLILFGNSQSRAVLHVGSFALPLLAFAACVAGLRATFPRFATYYCCLAAALMLAVYVPALGTEVGTRYSVIALALSALSLLAFILLALRATPPQASLAAIRRPSSAAAQ